MNLIFDPDADMALTQLENDPGRSTLLAKVLRMLDQLEIDDADRSVRSQRFSNGLWCVTIRDNDDEWWILWEPYPNEDESVLVQYVGPGATRA